MTEPASFTQWREARHAYVTAPTGNLALVDYQAVTEAAEPVRDWPATVRRVAGEAGVRIVAAAADEVGHYDAYHNAIFAAYNGAAGYSEQQLRVDFPATAGITGDDLTRFQELYDGRAFQDFVNGVEGAMAADNVTGTPTYIVDGTHLAFFDEDTEAALIDPTEEGFMKAVDAAYQG